MTRAGQTRQSPHVPGEATKQESVRVRGGGPTLPEDGEGNSRVSDQACCRCGAGRATGARVGSGASWLAAVTGSGSALSPAQSPNSAARAIPATASARPKNVTPAPPYHQSAPVRVPVRPPRKPDIGQWDEFVDDDDDLRRGDAAMLPPHEMVTRASAGGAGLAAPFSMLEGAGRTLKGRDLRRVRDAVLRQTRFLD
ncbi:uncharacterized protein LOC112885391 [Panicum hallii]|uniref:uncharacterized protein LOC112885391 n=1 Tax=Panicum hallii TaxID=206008 RepID=UPI000DF4EDA6|nr:uncharacterized protein LOC112885391 [Panicum hallii]